MKDILKNKKEWMSTKDLEKEKEIIDILNKKTSISNIAKELGYKKTTVYIDGKRRSGWVDIGMDLFVSLRNFLKSRKKYPLGFDYYYFGNEIFKTKLRDKIKTGELKLEDYFNYYPEDCRQCIGEGWDKEKNKVCSFCKK